MSSSTRPLLTYAILIVIVMIGLGVLLAQLTRGYFVNILEDRVEVESRYFVTYLESFTENSEVSRDELEEFSSQLDTGIVFLDESEEIIIDTVDAVDSISNAEKEKILSAVPSNGEISNSGRLIGDVFFYPTTIEVSNLEGTLVLLSPVDSLSSITRNIWLLISCTMFLGLLVIFIIGFNVFGKYVRPIRAATTAAKKLAKGDYRARTYEGYFGEAGELSQAINILARNLQEVNQTKGMQENQLEAVINHMGNGLVLIDEKGYILLQNRAFLETFGGEKQQYVGYLYHDAIPYTAIHETVQRVYMFEETVRETFVLPVNISRKHLEVTGAPILSEDQKWKGVVLVFHDITDLKQLEQTRKDFVANVSHELKTPITSIRGFSETLLDGAMKDEQMLEQFLRIILKESGRLQSLIQDLLDLSKLEREDFHLNIEQVDVGRLFQDLGPIVEQHAGRKGNVLSMDWKDGVLIEGDSSRLKQVFMNLITNAVNYTPEGGRVALSVEEQEESVTVIISDTGVGIPESEISRIFERFYRVDKARSRNSGGTGLGLAIVKHIIEAHRGNIRVESAVDEGTTFYVEIPKKFTEN
ncbi:ATP-binding protein [Halobacillus sp. ACCC02827]|uniref:two-component system histidine kinase PnpS n=1 Tax=Halobacillus sp. ACCC02827 TaxID=3052090 RepID=UPI0025709C2F|nr:ATP-binding protein [Halobacillus sp. ACCC02827]WJE14615.1 ATP-binding protein [Halobacillus sp. ACCC02827]